MGFMENSKPAMAMIGVECLFSGIALTSREVFSRGTNPSVFVFYRETVASIVMAAIILFSRRHLQRNVSVGLKGLAWIFVSAFFGGTVFLNAYMEGLHLASAATATVMINLVPGITFIAAAILRLEEVNLRSFRSTVKIIGTVVCVGGAISMALFRGSKLLNAPIQPPSAVLASKSDTDWLLGCSLLLASTFSGSFWLILNVPVHKNCPDHLLSISWMCFFGALQCSVIPFLLNADLKDFKLHSGLELFARIFTGTAAAITFLGQSWCVAQKGPLFCAMFNPLCTVIVNVLAAAFLHEPVDAGSLAGAATVIVGLYIVLWSKSEDAWNSQRRAETGEGSKKRDMKEPFV